MRASTERRGSLHPVSVAPMMQVTDRYQRAFMRRITRRALLYTEMVTTGAILRGDADRYLGFDEAEHPVAVQLGGDDPQALAQCARIAQDRGYDEVDLNVGCPSPRVSKGSFGASLMAQPERVADSVAAMRAAVTVPVTVKHRIGVDDLDSYEDLHRFVEVVAASGADRFIVHARKAWLKGLSPKQNRTVPPLRYDDVHRLKRDLPHLAIEINGGFVDLDTVAVQLESVDGVMIGRAADDNPWLFSDVDQRFYGEPGPATSRRQVVEAMVPYIEEHLGRGEPLHRVTRHMLDLFSGQPGARRWRRMLTEGAHAKGGLEVVRNALAAVSALSGG